MSAEKEFCDIYDVNKRPTGKTVDRAAIALNDDEYFLIVSAVLVSADKKILITKRDRKKLWSPGMWEIPGGGVKSGESSLEAIYREILEETNINLFSYGLLSYENQLCLSFKVRLILYFQKLSC